MYALRKIRDEFREKKFLTDPARIKEEINFAEKNLGIIKRQVCFKFRKFSEYFFFLFLWITI